MSTVFTFFSQTERINCLFLKAIPPWSVEGISVSRRHWHPMDLRSAGLDQVVLAPSPVSDPGQVRLGKSRRRGQTHGDISTQLPATPSWDFPWKDCVFQCKNSSHVFLRWTLSSCFLNSGKFKYLQLPVAVGDFYHQTPWAENLFSVVLALITVDVSWV